MSLIVKTFVRWITAPALLFSFYLFLHGHVSHGAGFAGGVLLALSFVLLLLAFGAKEIERRFNAHNATFAAAIMLFFLVSLAIIGTVSSAGFAGNILPKGKPFALFSSGSIIVANIALCVISAASLVWIFLSLLSFKRKAAEEESRG